MGPWDYWRPAADGVLELATVRGETVGLPAHFHGEDQLTFVLSGRRRFVIGGEVVVLEAGQGTLIPAGVLHRSLSEPHGVLCFNAYVPPAEYAVADLMSAIKRLRLEADRICWEAIMAAIRDHQRGLREIAGDTVASTASGATVGAAAIRMGVSREGFSRTFVKRYGMPPHAYWVMHRLNRARDQLRAGQDIADVAFETGFADQSHLGRWFKRAFGVSPGSYRRG
jgi:AraC-like DNA-binding protein